MRPQFWQTVAGSTLMLLLTTAGPAGAQLIPSDNSPKPEQPKTKATDRPTGPLTLRLHPAAEPDPALRYRLWPASEDRLDENPMTFINRAVLLVSERHRGSPEAIRESAEMAQQWREMPLDELPKREVEQYLSRYEQALKELARAENRMDVSYDLDLGELSVSERLSVLLPELQQSRELARLIALRVRLAIAEERWEDAIADLRLGFRLADSVGQSTDLLIGRLVGLAIAGVTLQRVQEAIQQPGCPNLYWAVAAIDAGRLYEVQTAIEFELNALARIVDEPTDLPDEPIGPKAARTRLLELTRSASDAFSVTSGVSASESAARLAAGAYTVAFADAARDLLAETQRWGDEAYQLSPPEAVLRAARLKVLRGRDRVLKQTYLPPAHQQDRDDLRSQRRDETTVADPLTTLTLLLTPAVSQAQRASRKVRQQQHLLLTLEAIRMHAAATGTLPESLEELKPVPAWEDSLALSPFGYRRSGETTATLTRGKRWAGDDQNEVEIKLIVKGEE